MTIFDRESLAHRVIAEGVHHDSALPSHLLAAALASGILSTLPASESVASETEKRLVAGTRTLEVNGRAARVYSLIGPDGRPGIRLRSRERFRVDLENQSGKQTLVHWHGQLPPWTKTDSRGPRLLRWQTGRAILRLHSIRERTGCIRTMACRNKS